jgi:hypothetical protein
LLQIVAGARIEVGRVKTLDGVEVNGFKVTIGGITDPASIERSYEDIERIFKSNESKFRVEEETTQDGKFKKYVVQT